MRLRGLQRPSEVAPRLPKCLIHHNVPGEPVHDLMAALDGAWDAAAPIGAFGARQRFVETVRRVKADGWPVVGGVHRWRLGEVTVPWASVSPELLSGVASNHKGPGGH